MKDLSKPGTKPSIVPTLAAAVAAVALIALGDYATGFEFDLSVLYLAPVCFVGWKIGRTGGVAVSVLAALAWFINDQITGHIFPHAFLLAPHSFLHLWKALILFTTWVIFVVLLDKLKIALARADERFSTVLEGLDQAVYVVEPESGELLYLNQRCREAFGGDKPLANCSQIESQLQSTRSTDRQGQEFVDLDHKRWYVIHDRTLRWVDGRTVILKAASDVTKRKQAEELNRQQQLKLQLTSQLATVGGMASTLAHEINQPLAAIANYNMGCVRRLRSGNWEPQELLAAMEKASSQAERAGSVIRRVREQIRKLNSEPVACDINVVLTEVASLIEGDAERYEVRMNLELAPEPPVARADKVMLEQAILNIARNGVESMQDTPTHARELTMRSRLEGDSNTIRIEIADTGCGIPDSMVGKSFEPFVSTKSQGMGLGLSLCRSIVELYEGQLWATRNPDRGSTFYLSLPLLES